MRTTMHILLLALGLLVLQAWVVAVLPAAVRPDPVLIFALAMGLRAGGSGGLVLAFGLGFVLDAVSGAPLGLYALLRGTACGLTRMFDRALYVRSALPWAIYVTLYALLDGILLALVMRLLVPEADLAWRVVLTRLPLSALLSGLLSAPILSWVLRRENETQTDGSRTSLVHRARS